MNLPTIEELFDPTPLIVSPETNFSEAIAQFNSSRQFDYILVINNRYLLGLLTAKDLIYYLSQDFANLICGNLKFSQPIYLKKSPDQNIFTVWNLYQETHYQYLVFVDDYDQFLGIITAQTIQSFSTNFLKHRTKELVEELGTIKQILAIKETLDPDNLTLENYVPIRYSLIQKISQNLQDALVNQQGLENELEMANQQLLDLIYALDQFAIVAITDSKGVISYVNNKFCEISQYSRQELIGKTHRLVNSGYHPPEYFKNLWSTITQGKIWRGEIKNKAKNGRYYWVDTVIIPYYDHQDQVRQYLAIRQDITERKRIDKALKNLVLGISWTKKESFFPSLVQFLIKALQVDYGLVGELIKTDHEMIQTLGVCNQGNILDNFNYDLNSSPCGDVIKGELCIYYQNVQQLFPENQILKELQIESYLGIPLLDHTGKVLGVMAVMSQFPLTEIEKIKEIIHIFAIRAASELERRYAEESLQKLNQELEKRVEERTRQLKQENKERREAEKRVLKALEQEKELNDLKTRFISLTSHEFRTPLSIISSSAGLLSDYSDRLSGEKQQKHLKRIQETVKYMAKLLEDILSMSNSKTSNNLFHLENFDLEEFCANLVEDLKLEGSGERIQFSSSWKEDTNKGQVWMDQKLLRQILTNLLSNGIKYSPQNTTVEFKLYLEGQNAVFLVKDQGIGIPPSDQKRLFESFHRAKNVGNIPGTGLGLAIVKKCVILHQGEISFTSSCDQGTTFIVKIPINLNEKDSSY